MALQRQYHYVYLTINKINGRKYIGDHSTCNLNDGYIGSGINKYNKTIEGNSAFNCAVRKYGYENFKREIVEECDTLEKSIEM